MSTTKAGTARSTSGTWRSSGPKRRQSQSLLMMLGFLRSQRTAPRQQSKLQSRVEKGEAGSSGSRATCTTTATATTVAKSVGDAPPRGIAKYSGTATGTTAAKSVRESEGRPPRIVRYTVTAKSELAVSPGGALLAQSRVHPVPLLQQPLSLLEKLGLLEPQSRGPRQSLNLQRVPVELGLLGPEQMATGPPLQLP